MTFEPPNPRACDVRIVALAIAVAIASAACKPASQNEAATGAQPANASGASNTPGADGAVAQTSGSIALHELDAGARAAPLSNGGLCALDSMNGAPLPREQSTVLSTPAMAVFSGWLGDASSKSWPLAAPSLRLDQVAGGRAWEVGLGAPLPRKDVAKALNAETMASSGFKVPVDLTSLPAGEYTVRLAYGGAVHRMGCDRHIRIRIGS